MMKVYILKDFKFNCVASNKVIIISTKNTHSHYTNKYLSIILTVPTLHGSGGILVTDFGYSHCSVRCSFKNCHKNYVSYYLLA